MGRPLPKLWRIFAFLGGLTVLAMLVIAWRLSPSPSGLGTHQQLGLPPCTTIVLYGIRCPSCGMTTSWSLLLHGQFVESGRTNLGGMLLCIIALAYLPASCYFTWYGRATRGEWFSISLAVALFAALGIAIVQWAWRLYSGS